MYAELKHILKSHDAQTLVLFPIARKQMKAWESVAKDKDENEGTEVLLAISEALFASIRNWSIILAVLTTVTVESSSLCRSSWIRHIFRSSWGFPCRNGPYFWTSLAGCTAVSRV